MTSLPKSEPVSGTSAEPVHSGLQAENSTLIPAIAIQDRLYKLHSGETAAREADYVPANMATIQNAASNSTQASAAPNSSANEMTEAELVEMENLLRDMYQQVYLSYLSTPF